MAGDHALKEEERQNHPAGAEENISTSAELEEQVEESREMFVNWAINNQLFATNTACRRPIENKATYQAPGKYNNHGQWQPGAIAQFDYIMINKNYRKAVTSSKSHCSHNLDSDHFPVTATMQCKFKNATPKSNKRVTAYSKQTELDREGMSKFFEEHIQEASSEHFQIWEQTYNAYLETLPSRERAKKQHWLSNDTWKLIQQKADEEWWWTEEERTWWTKEIKRKTKADKRRWLLNQVKEGMDEKEKWNGSKTLRKDYKQKGS